MKVREPTQRVSRAQRAAVHDRQRVSRVERRIARRRRDIATLRRQHEREEARMKAIRDRFTERMKQVRAERSQWRQERALLEELRQVVKHEAYRTKVRTWDQSEPQPDDQGRRQLVIRVRFTMTQNRGGWIVIGTDIEGIDSPPES